MPKFGTECSCASMESLPNAAQRTVYLMTYSRADMAKFPSRETFSSAVIEAWNSCGIRVVQWVVCIEAHSNDCESIDEMPKERDGSRLGTIWTRSLVYK